MATGSLIAGPDNQGDHSASGKPGNVREFVKRVEMSGNLQKNGFKPGKVGEFSKNLGQHEDFVMNIFFCWKICRDNFFVLHPIFVASTHFYS